MKLVKFGAALSITLLIFTINVISPLQCSTDSSGYVAFRLDDVGDFPWRIKTQDAVLDILLKEEVGITLGIIPGYFGNNFDLVSKIKSGIDSGVFDIAMHGWRDENFTELTYEEQVEKIKLANRKLRIIFGFSPKIFTPPYHEYNEETIKALFQNTDVEIISSHLSRDNPPFPFKDDAMLHFPTTVDTAFIADGLWHNLDADQVLTNVESSVDSYGFAVVIWHPQQFMKVKNGAHVDEPDEEALMFLKEVIAGIRAKGLKIVPLSKLYLSLSDLSTQEKTSYSFNPSFLITPLIIAAAIIVAAIVLLALKERGLLYKVWDKIRFIFSILLFVGPLTINCLWCFR